MKDNKIKTRLIEMMNRVNKININESSFYGINNSISKNDPIFRYIITEISKIKIVEKENRFNEYSIFFDKMNVIDDGGAVKSNKIHDMVLGFDEIEIMNNSTDEQYRLDSEAERELLGYINNNKFWSEDIYQEAFDYYYEKINDPSNYIDEDIIKGGLADKKNIEDFDNEQLKKGIEVEMEHTNDVNIAMEIAMDHLTENPKYYGDNGSDSEICAMCGAASDTKNNNNTDSDEFVDILLGFKPLNVGDYVN